MTTPNNPLPEDDEDVELSGYLIRKHRDHWDVRDPKTEHWTDGFVSFESARLFIEWRTGVITWGQYLAKDFFPRIKERAEAEAAAARSEREHYATSHS